MVKNYKLRPEIRTLIDRVEISAFTLFFLYMWLRAILFVGGIDL